MQKLTKIVATIGPVTDSEESIEKLIKAGVNIFRFNFKHSSIEWHNERIERVNKVAARLGIPVGTLIDLQGPEIRINMSTPSIETKKGELLLFGPEALEEGKEKGFSISHPDIIQYLKPEQKLLADDGAYTFYVVKKGDKTYLRCDTEGTLATRKSLNIPGADFPFPVLVDRDFEGLQLAARAELDFVALSFVRTVSDLEITRQEMKKYNVKAKMVAKIETQKALDNIDAIIEASDAVMVARGDLGVELPIEQVPYYQKLIIKKCLKQGIPVITATQMLQSMIQNPYPTRAEVSDIANATYDLTDAVMLSGETASGAYPLDAVEMMAKTVLFHEQKSVQDTRMKQQFNVNDTPAMICDAAYTLYLQSVERQDKIAAFVVFSHSGRTARLLSRYRPGVPIYVFTPNSTICDSLTINFGVYPFVKEVLKTGEVTRDDVEIAIDFLKKEEYLHKGGTIIVLHGNKWAVQGGTSTVKMVTV